MKKQKTHTNEELRDKFNNQFELVNYAIGLAENMIYSGRDTRIKTDVQNRAYQILEEIKAGVDKFDDITPEGEREEELDSAQEAIKRAAELPKAMGQETVSA